MLCAIAWNGQALYADVEEGSPEDAQVAATVLRLNQLSGEEGLRECERALQQPEPEPGFHTYIKTRRVYLLYSQSPETAINELHRYIQESPTPAERRDFRMLLVEFLEYAGQYETAIAEQQSLIEETEQPDQRADMSTLARLQLYGPNPSAAMETWERIESQDRAAGGQISSDVVFGRVQSLLALNRPQEALREFERFVPSESHGTVNYWSEWVQLHNMKARTHDQLGQPELAERERVLARGAFRKMQESGSRFTRHLKLPSMPPLWVWAIPIPIIWLIYIAAAWRQRRQERGTWASLILVTGAMACLCMLPLAAFVIQNMSETLPDNQQFINAIVGTLFSFGYTLFFFKSLLMATPDRKTQPYPEVEENEVLQAVEALSTRFGIRPPSVRRFPPLMHFGAIHAQVSGLVASTVTIHSDVLHRLTSEERNAVLAHELAHIRNHTLGIYASMAPLAMTLGVGLLPNGDLGAYLIWSWLCWSGLWMLVSRWLEYDCDRRAAALCGPEHKASALVKVHAASAIHDEGLIARLAYATQTHPSREQRLGALADRFPDVAWTVGVWSPERRAAQTRTSWLVGIVWLGLLAALCLAPAGWGRRLIITLSGVALFAPMILLRLAWRPEVSRNLRRIHGKSWNWRKIFAVVMLIMAVVVAFDWILRPQFARSILFRGDSQFFAFLIPVGLIVVVWLIMRMPRAKVEGISQRIMAAMMQRDWPQVLSIAESEAEAVSRDFDCSHNTALARWLNGDHETAVSEMKTVSEKFPDRAVSLLLLWDMSIENEDWDTSIQVADLYLHRFPEDPLGYSIKTSGLLRRGRAEEARELIQSRDWPEEEAFNKLAIEARLALHDRDWLLSRKQLDQAEAIIPGVLRLRLLRAELELECGDLDQAGKILDQAERQLADSPFDLVSQRTARLRTRWCEAVVARQCDEI